MNNIAYIVTALSMIGTFANSHKKRWCFLIWLCTNAFWCIYNFINGQYAQALLYVFNFCMSVTGLLKWKEKDDSSLRRRYEYIKNENRQLKALNDELYKINEETDSLWQARFSREVSNWENQIADLNKELEFERSRQNGR